jgi:predicted CoA-substrate-specific enzyme activase
MIVAGCDVGSLTAKAVILDDGRIVGSGIIRCGASPEASARTAMQAALDQAGVALDAVAYCVGTGYGRKNISFGDAVESEISCHARGAVWQAPSVRTIVDIGGQDAKAIKLDEHGRVLQYLYNDKCASGTGRFLEVIADALGIELDALGALAEQSTERLTLSNQCVVFAETEILSLVSEGKETTDIVMAMHRAVARRAAAMARSIGLVDDVAMTGGVARNSGMFDALREALGTGLTRVPRPQVNGAIGAALFAAEATGCPSGESLAAVNV